MILLHATNILASHLPSMVEYASISSGVTEGSETSNSRKKIIMACMHACIVTCSYIIILCGDIVCFCFTGATTSSIEQPTPTADSSSPGVYTYYDCVTTLMEQVTIPMRMPVLFFCSYYC